MAKDVTSCWESVLGGPVQFLAGKHREFIENESDKTESLEHLLSSHLRMGGLYWSLGSLEVMGFLSEELEKKEEPLKIEEMEGKGTGSSAGTPNELATKPQILRFKDLLQWVSNCWDPIGNGYGSDIGHDAHIVSTLVRVVRSYRE